MLFFLRSKDLIFPEIRSTPFAESIAEVVIIVKTNNEVVIIRSILLSVKRIEQIAVIVTFEITIR